MMIRRFFESHNSKEKKQRRKKKVREREEWNGIEGERKRGGGRTNGFDALDDIGRSFVFPDLIEDELEEVVIVIEISSEVLDQLASDQRLQLCVDLGLRDGWNE